MDVTISVTSTPPSSILYEGNNFMNSIANGSQETETLENLHNFQVKNIDRIIIGTLNINSIANNLINYNY